MQSTTEREIRLSPSVVHTIGALRIIDSLTPVQHKVESSIVHTYDGNIRYIRNLVTGAETVERKIRNDIESAKVSTDGPYKFVVSTETIAKPVPFATIRMTVYRLRYIYDGYQHMYENKVYPCSVHVTFRTEIIHGTREQVKSFPSVEVEIPTMYSDAVIASIANTMLRMHNGYEVSNLEQKIINARNVCRNATSDLQRPFDIKYRDMTYANLIAKPHAISFKADGTRMLLLCVSTGVYLVSSSFSPMPIHDKKYEETYLIDGELVGGTYYAFDILLRGNTDLTQLPYNERHRILSDVGHKIGTIPCIPTLPIIPNDKGHIATGQNSIIFVVKPIIIPTSADVFFDGCTAMIGTHVGVNGLTKVMNHTLETDGLIITPVEQEYKGRVYKWKPSSKLTVDFFVASTTNIYTFNEGKMIDLSTLTYNSIPIQYIVSGLDVTNIGTVCEFYYLGTVNGIQRWSYSRTRMDKTIPNRFLVYTDIMRIHEDPIDTDTMCGKGLRLMRKYHNRAKTDLYDILRRRFKINTIMDIGSGKGGDLSKWVSNGFNVYAIEPNESNINEFIERATTYGLPGPSDIVSDDISVTIPYDGKKIELIHGTAEGLVNNYYDIEQVDALTLFNSATFLGRRTLNDLATSYTKDRGIVVVMVIDGKVLLHNFLNDGTSTSYGGIGKNIRIQYSKDSTCTSIRATNVAAQVGEDRFGDLGCISILLEGSATVAESQKEGLVDVDVLIKGMVDSGFIPTYDAILNDELLLNTEERLYTAAQRILIFRNGPIDPPILLPLDDGDSFVIDPCPYGQCIRVGVPQTSDDSFDIAVVYAMDSKYRSLPTKDKIRLLPMYYPAVVGMIRSHQYPIYAILPDSWDMYEYDYTTNTVYRYPYQSYYHVHRRVGIVLMYDELTWTPLVLIKNGVENYIW